jgi:tetratricopeptide (TPR) repeat protein
MRGLLFVSLLGVTLFCGGVAAEQEDASALLGGTDVAHFARASEIFEERVAVDPNDPTARLGAAIALTQTMAVRTHGNLPLVDGLQDTPANKALWAELAPRALEHAKAALALEPGSAKAATAVATAYMFHASSLGIVSSILSGAAGEYRTHVQRLIDHHPRAEDALGDYMMASFLIVAPWPVSDSDQALVHYQRAAKLAPESVRNQYGFGVYWAREGEPDRARDHFQKAVSMPCTENTERLFCDFMRRTAQRELDRLGSR